MDAASRLKGGVLVGEPTLTGRGKAAVEQHLSCPFPDSYRPASARPPPSAGAGVGVLSRRAIETKMGGINLTYV
jgi:hypothetical protein